MSTNKKYKQIIEWLNNDLNYTHNTILAERSENRPILNRIRKQNPEIDIKLVVYEKAVDRDETMIELGHVKQVPANYTKGYDAYWILERSK